MNTYIEHLHLNTLTFLKKGRKKTGEKNENDGCFLPFSKYGVSLNPKTIKLYRKEFTDKNEELNECTHPISFFTWKLNGSISFLLI